MNDKQIRLEILLDYYMAMKNQSKIPIQENNKKLKDIDSKDYDFNYGYLVKHDLIKGAINSSTDGTEYYSPTGGITAYGMDVIEKFIDDYIKIKKIKNLSQKSYIEKIIELITIWSTKLNLYEHAWELLNSYFSVLS